MDDQRTTTSLIELRNFLRARNCAPAPWAGPEHVIETLYASLRNKQNDETFWAELKELVDRLEDERFRPQALAGARVLPDDSLERLIDDLRRSLRANGNGNGHRVGLKKWLGHSACATALLAFLVLGTAVTLGDNGTSRAASIQDQELVDEALFTADDEPIFADEVAAIVDEESEPLDAEEAAILEEELFEYDTEVAIDLLDIISFADVPNQVRQDLLDCLPELDATYREALLEKFQYMNDAELANYLEAMSQSEGVQKYLNGELAGDDVDEANAEDAADNANILQQMGDDFSACCGCGTSDDDDDDH
ncbi:MAG TPA: hypothetical protein PKW95_03175 [bacterium]|nr:hypothetical protein [bacterium]